MKKDNITIFAFGIMGILLRITFIPFAMHKDILWIHGLASKMAYHGVFNIYNYINTGSYTHIVSAGTSYYGPLAYYILGGFYFFIKPIIPGLGHWFDIYSGMVASGDYSNYLSLFNIPFLNLCSYISAMKFSYVIFDLCCLLLLWALFRKKEDRLRAFKFWMINPVIIFGSYIFGQFDIAIALFLLLALFMIRAERPYAAMFVIGCASLFKSTPLILILPICIILGKDFKRTIQLLVTGVAPIALTMVPLYALTGNYIITALFPKFLSTSGAKYLDTIEFSIGKGIFIFGYIYIVSILILNKWKRVNINFDVWRYMLGLLLLSYFIIYTPIHYFQWVIPLLIVGVVNNNIPRSVYIFQIVCLFVYAINSRPLSAQLFLPLSPEYLYNLRSLPEYMNQFIKWGVVMRTARLLFYCCSVYIIWKVLFKPEVGRA